MNEVLLVVLESLLLVGLVSLSAFFSSSEIALFSLSRAKLLAYKDSPLPSRRRIHDLMSDYHGTLICIILANMFVNSCLSMLNEELLSSLHLNPLLTSVLSAAIGIVLLLLFGEITPMTIAYIFAEKWSAKVSGPIWILRKALFPVVFVVEAICNKILDFLGRRKPKPLNQEEYLSYLETCMERRAFAPWEAKLLRSAFALRDKTAGEIMRARVDLPFIKTGTPPEIVEAAIRESKQSQILVGPGSLESADMALSSRGFFMLDASGRESWWTSSCVSKAVFIPSGCSLTKALRTLRAGSAHAAVVIDEYGGLAGMISRQDIYAEIVGRAGEDENGSSGWQVFRAGPNKWIFDGLSPLSFVESVSGWTPPEGSEAKTLGGLLCEALGSLPAKGACVDVDGAELCAAELDGNRVSEVVLSLASDAKEGAS